jgi:excinuclease ABC subunit C
MDAALARTLEELPAEPGCYLMKDRQGEVVYVGKAASLRSRVRSYFGGAREDDRAFVALLDEILGDVQVIVTRTEKEAVLLENQLIKKHRPRFNVVLRDDKDFIVLKLDLTHPYPRLEVRRAREARAPGARYFGPFSSAWSIRETLKVVNRHFQLRTCTDHVFDTRRRPCILYQIHRCPAPCVYQVPAEEYRASVDDAVAFLEGREPELTTRLEARMRDAAEGLRFEQAARLRDQLQAVRRSLETQRVLMGDGADRDVVGLHREGPDLVVQVLEMRGGKLSGSRAFPFKGLEAPGAELLSQFLAAFYEQVPAPDEVLLPLEPDEAGPLADVLSERRGARVRLLTPQRGAKADLLEVAARNAAQSFVSWHEKDERREEALVSLARSLHLARPPRWMECYDISTFQGALAVGSGVSLRDGEPDKAGYRRYKVKGVAGQDDFAMLHEVMTRRLRRAVAEGRFPDLVVIDGGKGQLNAALAAARDVGVPTRPSPGNPEAPFVEMVALAKGRPAGAADLGTARVVGRRGGRGAPAARALADAAEAREKGFVSEQVRSPERVFLPGRRDPVVLRQNSAELFLLARLRDEAHRFAITFHRTLRRQRNFQSVLESIPGVGEGRKRALLRHFGSLRKVREASLEALREVEGFGARQAAAVHGFFHGAEGGPPAAGDGPTEAEIDAALEGEPGEHGAPPDPPVEGTRAGA